MRCVTCLCVAVILVAALSQGCAVTYYHVQKVDGYRRTEVGLLGSGGPGGVPGLIPLFRANVPLEEAAQTQEAKEPTK